MRGKNIPVASEQANALVAQSLYEQGQSVRQVARHLGCSPATAWKYKHTALLDPDLIQHASKTISDKALLGATAAIDEILDQAETGQLKHSTPAALAKTASILMQSSQAYAAATGVRDTLASMMESFGLQPSHTASSLTVTQSVSVTVSGSAPAPRVVDAEADGQAE